MKIWKITEDGIYFDGGHRIEFDHDQDCCEQNYADFEQVDDIARAATFTHPLQFEAVDGFGFRFGNENNMHFVPCYSCQNGYYSSDIKIYYDGEEVLSINAEEIID